MRREKNVPLDQNECSELFYTMFKAMHIYGFNNSQPEDLKQYLSMYVNDTFHTSRNFPDLEQIDSRELIQSKESIYSEIIDKLTEWHTLEDGSLSQAMNKWLSPAHFPINRCSNLKQISEERYSLSQNTILNPTLAHQLHFSRNNFQSGTCISCARDRNRHSLKNGINLMDSKVFTPTTCTLSMANQKTAGGFKIDLKVSENKSGRFRLYNISVTKGFKTYVKAAFNFVGINVNKESRMSIIIDEYMQENYNSNDFVINLKILPPKKSRKYGTMTELVRQGYYPKFHTVSLDEEQQYSQTLFLEKVMLVNGLLVKSCNPLYFENVKDVFKTENHSLQDKIAYVPPDSIASSWPLQYISGNLATLERISEQASSRELELEHSSILFKLHKDKSLEDGIVEFSIDTIRFWM